MMQIKVYFKVFVLGLLSVFNASHCFADELFSSVVQIAPNSTRTVATVPAGQTLQVLHVTTSMIDNELGAPQPQLQILSGFDVVGVLEQIRFSDSEIGVVCNNRREGNIGFFEAHYQDRGLGSGVVVEEGTELKVRLINDPAGCGGVSGRRYRVVLAGKIIDNLPGRCAKSYSATINSQGSVLGVIPNGKRFIIMSVHSEELKQEFVGNRTQAPPTLQIMEDQRIVTELPPIVDFQGRRPAVFRELVGPVVRGGCQLTGKLFKYGAQPEPAIVVVTGVLEDL